ncbi:uncharacterized protein LOC110617479 isoform X3 [Manihot esculenta]|uniref:uncharacterized protein LOC110617479 isoform X3 n=1 Tax=Manihot esculenta TaxID=3983 RepID=UPI001CC467A9|nr:uncharacterized protein LOC110617479 isoform X3 [Manihot esculenta]
MSFITGSSQNTWHPAMTANTATARYWLNWRFFLCTIWVLISISIASILIWKNENFHKAKRENGENKQETGADLQDEETWRPCLKGIHPAWLLVFRVFAFFVLLVLLIVVVLVDGGSIFYYYTQWTFTLVTIYFGLGSFLSMRGCYLYHKRAGGDKVDNVEVDSEQGNCATPAPGESSNASIEKRSPNSSEQVDECQPAGKWAFFFQIVFQMNAGAVMLTDCVFWFVIVPFLAIKDYHLTARFPWFRIAYFYIWTITYLLFQWIVHACVRLWWPYPFLDLSSPYAPLWYFSVGVMHVPCYGIFAFIIKLKHTLFSRWFPDSYQCPR